MTTHEMPSCRCLRCGHKFDLGTIITTEGKERPGPGDFSLCIKCAFVMRFDENLTVRELTFDEYMELPEETRLDIVRAVGAILAIRAGLN